MNKLKYREAWRWPGQVEDFIRQQCEGFVVHVMNGDSKLGDARIDLYSESTDIRADALHLPLKSAAADTVVCDPPWNMPDHEKYKLMIEIRRVLKLGGKLILRAPWNPKCPGMKIEGIWVPEWQLMRFSHIALIWVARKYRAMMEQVCDARLG